MKTIEWVIIGGVVIIGLYATGVLSKFIPSIATPYKNPISINQTMRIKPVDIQDPDPFHHYTIPNTGPYSFNRNSLIMPQQTFAV